MHLCQDYLDKGEDIAGAFLDHVRTKLDGLQNATSSAKLLSSEDDEPQICDEAADGSARGALGKKRKDRARPTSSYCWDDFKDILKSELRRSGGFGDSKASKKVKRRLVTEWALLKPKMGYKIDGVKRYGVLDYRKRRAVINKYAENQRQSYKTHEKLSTQNMVHAESFAGGRERLRQRQRQRESRRAVGMDESEVTEEWQNSPAPLLPLIKMVLD